MRKQPVLHKNLYKLIAEENTGVKRIDITYACPNGVLTVRSDDGPWVRIWANPRTAMFCLEGRAAINRETSAPFIMNAGTLEYEITADGEITVMERHENISYQMAVDLAARILTSRWALELRRVFKKSHPNEYDALAARIDAATFRIKQPAVGRALREHRQDLFAAVPEKRMAIFAKMFSTIGEAPSVVFWDALDRDPYLERDILSHRWMRYLYCTFTGERLQEVKRLVAENATLRRSLMRMPGGISRDVLGNIIAMVDDGLVLRSPLPADRVYWIALSAIHGGRARSSDDAKERASRLQKRYDILHRTPPQALRRQVKRYSERMKRQAPERFKNFMRSPVAIHRYCMDVFDIDDEWVAQLGRNATFVRLEEASQDWHRMDRIAQLQDKFAGDKSVAMPPIPLPADNRVRMLEKVGDFIQEHMDMSHCIDVYAQNAVEGDGYYFHVQGEDGSAATVEVAPDYSGKWAVRQSKGPFNSHNQAAKTGHKLLSKWAANLPAREIENPVGDDFPFSQPARGGFRNLRWWERIPGAWALLKERSAPDHDDWVFDPTPSSCGEFPLPKRVIRAWNYLIDFDPFYPSLTQKFRAKLRKLSKYAWIDGVVAIRRTLWRASRREIFWGPEPDFCSEK